MRLEIVKLRADARFLNELVNVALERRVPITLGDMFIAFDVPDLPAFLRCVWRVYAEFSRTSLGVDNHRKRIIRVVDYNVYVWYRCEIDEGGCYIRYGEVLK